MAATQTSPAPSAGKRDPQDIRRDQLVEDQLAEAARRHDRVRWSWAAKRAARKAVSA